MNFIETRLKGAYTIEITTRFELTSANYALSLNVVPSNCGAAGLLPTRQAFDPHSALLVVGLLGKRIERLKRQAVHQ